MQVFPASIPLDGRTVIVVGRGPMAEPKVRLFAASPARLLWFTGNTDDPVPADIAQYARIERRMPTRRDLLVVYCTGTQALLYCGLLSGSRTNRDL